MGRKWEGSGKQVGRKWEGSGECDKIFGKSVDVIEKAERLEAHGWRCHGSGVSNGLGLSRSCLRLNFCWEATLKGELKYELGNPVELRL